MRFHLLRERRQSVCLALLAIVCSLLWLAPPLAGQTTINGLGSDALVVTDIDGVPHICTGTDRDTMLMLGWVHARDRFFQMDTLRRQFSGTLAELVGSPAVASDVQFRTFGLRRAAQATLAAYEARGLDETLDLLDAYALGVNTYLASAPLPPEYGALELSRVEAWTPIDSLVVAKGLAFGLSFNLLELDLSAQAVAYATAGAAGGFDGMALLFEDVTRTAPFDDTVSIPGALLANSVEAQAAAPGQRPRTLQAPSAEAAALARQYLEKASEIPALAKALDPRASDTGSNWWLVAPSRSATGHAMLANDPHLGLNTPSTFYEAHLLSSPSPGCGIALEGSSEALTFRAASPATAAVAGDRAPDAKSQTGLDATGVSFAGVPGIVLGCNQHACWGATVHPLDVTDVYQESLVVNPATGLPSHTIFRGEQEPLVLIPQQFAVNVVGDGTFDNRVDAGVGPTDGGVTLVVPRRNNGPIIALSASTTAVTGLSVQYTGWGPTFELDAFLSFQRVASVEAFRTAVQRFDVGSQNFAYADVDGNIAYFTSAEMPLREDLQTLGFPDGGVPPFLIRDGTGTLQHEWLPATDPGPDQALPYEILPFEEMPQVVNPPAGYIVNANNDPIGTSLDNNPLNQLRPGGGLYYLNPGYVSLRVGRIRRALEAVLEAGPATIDDLKAIQANNQLLDAELMMPYLLTAFANASDPEAPTRLALHAADPGIVEAIGRLASWNFSTPTGIAQGFDPGDDPDALAAPSAAEVDASIAATIWSTFRGQAVQFVIDGTLTRLGLADFLPDSRSAYNALENLLETFDTNQGVGASGVPFIPPFGGLTPAQERDVLLLSSLREALDVLASNDLAPAFGNSTNQDDYRWGNLHRIVFDHPLGDPFSVPNGGGFSDVSPTLRGVARSGGYEAVDASSHSARADGVDEFMFGSGPARRFVGVLDPERIRAEEIIPGGQQAVLGSPGYASQLGRWLTNDYHPLRTSPTDIAAASADAQTFEPGCTADGETLCLQRRRFAVTNTWSLPTLNGIGQVVPGASDLSGNFYFFRSANWEMLVKVLDGCSSNGHYWVFIAGTTNVGWDLRVTDTVTGIERQYGHAFGPSTPATIDTRAFACPQSR